MMSIIQEFLEHSFISRFYAFVEPCLPSLNTVNPLLNPQGAYLFQAHLRGGLIDDLRYLVFKLGHSRRTISHLHIQPECVSSQSL